MPAERSTRVKHSRIVTTSFPISSEGSGPCRHVLTLGVDQRLSVGAGLLADGRLSCSSAVVILENERWHRWSGAYHRLASLPVHLIGSPRPPSASDSTQLCCDRAGVGEFTGRAVAVPRVLRKLPDHMQVQPIDSQDDEVDEASAPESEGPPVSRTLTKPVGAWARIASRGTVDLSGVIDDGARTTLVVLATVVHLA